MEEARFPKFCRWLGFAVLIYCFVNGAFDVYFRAIQPFVNDVYTMVIN